jgi:hypothetical protein
VIEDFAQALTKARARPLTWQEASRRWHEQRHKEDLAAAPSCPECGTNVVEAGRVLCVKPVYCSDACKQRAYRRRKRDSK